MDFGSDLMLALAWQEPNGNVCIPNWFKFAPSSTTIYNFQESWKALTSLKSIHFLVLYSLQFLYLWGTARGLFSWEKEFCIVVVFSSSLKYPWYIAVMYVLGHHVSIQLFYMLNEYQSTDKTRVTSEKSMRTLTHSVSKWLSSLLERLVTLKIE